MTKEEAIGILESNGEQISKDARDGALALIEALDAAGAFGPVKQRGLPNMSDRELIDLALAALRRTVLALQTVSSGPYDHLISYAFDGIGSAQGYLETARRRLDDPEAD